MTTNTSWARRAATVGMALGFALPAAAQAAPGDPVLGSEEKALWAQVNGVRAQHGLASLKASVALTKSSKWLSADMARNDYFGHTDSLGRSYSQRISAFGYRSRFSSENIAAGSAQAAATVKQWMGSAPHRRNLLSRSAKVIGIGSAYDARSTLRWYWTATFGATTDRTMPS